MRWSYHYLGQKAYPRDDAIDIEDAKVNKDCVKIFENYLISNKIIDCKYADDLKLSCSQKIDELIERAVNCEYTKFDDVYRKEYIYAMPETGGDI